MLHKVHDHHVLRNFSPARTDLADAEWDSLTWGNLQANVDFLSRTDLAPPASILEIGCGKGVMLNHLRGLGYTVAGIDKDASPLFDCRSLHPELPVCLASGDAIPFADGSFEAVLSFDLFEHIKNSDRHLAEVRRVLKRGGCYMLQTPNKWTNIPFEILRQWKKHHTGPLESYHALLQEHCALHNYWQLRRRFAHNGFDTLFLDVPSVNEYFKSKMRTYMGTLGPLLTAALNPDRWPLPLRTNFYVIASSR